MAIDPNTRILVVDDIQGMRSQLRTMLNTMGFKGVFEAESGLAALTILKKEDIGFVITDWRMPGMTGIELLKEIRKENTTLPVLMITAEAHQNNVLEAIKAGVNNYIIKPFDGVTLQKKMREIFGK
ncbi:MAG: two-component system chemotaxis response regulator CheY [bacterium]|jgi:two-component system chemotaxis response regulator CheY